MHINFSTKLFFKAQTWECWREDQRNISPQEEEKSPAHHIKFQRHEKGEKELIFFICVTQIQEEEDFLRINYFFIKGDLAHKIKETWWNLI